MIVSGIVADEVEAVVAGYRAAGFEVGEGAGDGGRVDRAAVELLSPDRAAAEGAALGQLACELPGGGLLITASRLVEFGARAAILLAPGLFRLDFTPQEETLGLYPRALGPWEVEWRAARDLGRLSRPDGPGADRAAPGASRPGLHGLDPRALVHGTGRLGHALRGQGRDPAGRRTSPAADWYERVRRPLPWRATRDPYALLVREVMLQQTQALRVVPYYERWLERFPDAAALARGARRATCWRCGPGSATTGVRWRCSGRRRSSPRTAGRPISPQLPGVGPYTAAAVARSRGTAQVAAVDTNVRRVLTRRDGSSATPRALAGARGELLPGRAGRGVQPGDDGARRDGLPPARARLRRVPGVARAVRGRAAAPRRARPVRFEDTDRWARGRVVAALLAGERAAGAGRAPRARAGAGSSATAWSSASRRHRLLTGVPDRRRALS